MNGSRSFIKSKPVVLGALFLFVLAACASPAATSTPTAGPTATATTAPVTPSPKPEPRLIGFQQLLVAGCDFCAEVEKNIKAVFEANGDEVFVLDNKFDVAQTVANADVMVSKKVDILICFCQSQASDQILAKTRGATPKIPVIFVDGFPTDTGTDWSYFGANGNDSGQKSGQWVVDYAKANWGGSIDAVVSTLIPEWEPVTMGRFSGFVDVLNAFDPKITADSITQIDAKLEFEKVQLAGEAFLNANPDKRHLVMYGPTSDVHGLAFLAAAKKLGREADVVILSHGADAQVRAELSICTNALKASLAYFPDRYGEFLFPIVNATLAGEAVQHENFVNHQVVDCKNLKDFYPNG